MNRAEPCLTSKVTARDVLTDPLIAPIIVVVFLVLMGFGLVFPVFPLFARSFGVGYDGTGLLIGTFGFARLFGDLIGGAIVDRRGERATAIVGMTLLGLCSAATGAAPSYAWAIVTWGAAGVGSAIVFASLFSFILKAAPKDRIARTLSFFYGAFNVGVIAGGAVGGIVAHHYGLAAPLFAYTLVLAVAVLVYLRFVPDLPARSPALPEGPSAVEAAGAEAPRPSGAIALRFFEIPGFATALFLNFTYLWIVASVFNTLLPLFAKDRLAMGPATIGIMFAVAVGAEFLVLFPAGALADRLGRKRVMIPSLVGLVVTVAALGWTDSPAALTAVLALVAFASGFAGVPPAAMLSDVVPDHSSGRAVGAFRFAGDIGFFLGPLAAGMALTAYGFETTFALTTLVPVAAIVLACRTAETMPRIEAGDGSGRG